MSGPGSDVSGLARTLTNRYVALASSGASGGLAVGAEQFLFAFPAAQTSVRSTLDAGLWKSGRAGSFCTQPLAASVCEAVCVLEAE